MAGMLIPEPAALNPDANDWQRQLQRTAVQGKDHFNVMLTDIGGLGQSSIAAGSSVAVNHSLYHFLEDEQPEPPAEGFLEGFTYYVYITGEEDFARAFCNFNVPLWDVKKGGWYFENNRAAAFFIYYKNEFHEKTLLESYYSMYRPLAFKPPVTDQGTLIWEAFAGESSYVFAEGVYLLKTAGGRGGNGGQGGHAFPHPHHLGAPGAKGAQNVWQTVIASGGNVIAYFKIGAGGANGGIGGAAAAYGNCCGAGGGGGGGGGGDFSAIRIPLLGINHSLPGGAGGAGGNGARTGYRSKWAGSGGAGPISGGGSAGWNGINSQAIGGGSGGGGGGGDNGAEGGKPARGGGGGGGAGGGESGTYEPAWGAGTGNKNGGGGGHGGGGTAYGGGGGRGGDACTVTSGNNSGYARVYKIT